MPLDTHTRLCCRGCGATRIYYVSLLKPACDNETLNKQLAATRTFWCFECCFGLLCSATRPVREAAKGRCTSDADVRRRHSMSHAKPRLRKRRIDRERAGQESNQDSIAHLLLTASNGFADHYHSAHHPVNSHRTVADSPAKQGPCGSPHFQIPISTCTRAHTLRSK